MTNFKLKSILKDWISLNSKVNSLSEDELTELLHQEMIGKKRVSFVKRIVIRQNKLIGEERLARYIKGLK